MDLAKELVRRRGARKVAQTARVLGVSRSNLHANRSSRPRRYERSGDDEVRSGVLDLLKRRETYGYKRAAAILNRERRKAGLAPWNKKRVYRVMRINKLLVPSRAKRPQREHTGKVMTIASNVRWCTDILQINCWSGEKAFVAFSLDCHDREAIAFVAKARPLTHRDAIELMDLTMVARFGEWAGKLEKPIQWLSDQGPQYIAHETKDYARQWGLEPITTPAYSPESNGMAESFVKTFKRDYVYVSDLWTAESVLRQIPNWFADYNRHHPHSALKFMSPLEYRNRETSDE